MLRLSVVGLVHLSPVVVAADEQVTTRSLPQQLSLNSDNCWHLADGYTGTAEEVWRGKVGRPPVVENIGVKGGEGCLDGRECEGCLDVGGCEGCLDVRSGEVCLDAGGGEKFLDVWGDERCLSVQQQRVPSEWEKGRRRSVLVEWWVCVAQVG